MQNCINYNCTSLPDHEDPSCGGNLLGGIDSMLLLECDHGITDFSDAVDVQASIDAGKSKLVNSIRVGIDAPSPIEVDSVVSCIPAGTINYDRTGTLIDGTINSVNINFWNEIFDGRRLGGALLHLCDSGKVFHIDSAITFQGGITVPDDNTDLIKVEATFKWKDKVAPSLIDAPVGIFG